MRRTLTTLALSLTTLVLTALPTFAADTPANPVEDAPEGSMNGILFALIVGTIVGVALFLDAYRGDPGHREHHGDEAGH